ncbi:MAG: hypothetical protein IJF54_01075 [Clostridia bacterium]|nr:hypothetical protein [Clostridia bacterium]
MKRCLSLVVAICLMMGMFASVGMTASAENVQIDTIIITGIKAAVIGEQSTVDTIAVPDDANYEIEDAYWIDELEHTDFDGVFEENGKYDLCVSVVPKAGYEFKETAFVEANEEEEYAVILDDSAEIHFVFSFLEMIDEISITGVKEPVVGEQSTIDGITAPDGADYTVVGASWSYKNMGDYSAFDGVFENGKKYYLDVNIIANEGYEFNPDLKITLNGKTYDGDYYAGGIDASLYLEYSFLEKINEINFPAFPEIEVGDTAEEFEKEIGNIIFHGDWWESVGEGGMDLFTDEFEDKKAYAYNAWAEPKEGYEFAEDIVIKVDGVVFESIYNIHEDEYVEITKLYDLGDNLIHKIEITISDIKIGEEIDDTPILPEDAKYEVPLGMVGVSDTDDLADAEAVRGEYEENKYYWYEAIVVPKEGCMFADDLKVTINGLDVEINALADLIGFNNTPVSMFLIKSFGKLDDTTVDNDVNDKDDEDSQSKPQTKPEDDFTNPSTGSGFPVALAMLAMGAAAVCVASAKSKKK